MEKVIEEAYKISLKALKRCSGDSGYFAALNHYHNYWARDAFFASLGAVYANDSARVKKQLLFFMKHQKKSGHVPRLVPKNPFIRLLMNVEVMFDNPFLSPFWAYFSKDQNSLLVISAWEYIQNTKDKAFAEKYFDNFERAVSWNFKYDHDKDMLIEQGGFSDWKDSMTQNHPESLYTNICSYEALLSLSRIAQTIGNEPKRKQYMYMAKIVKEQININYWTGEFYADSVEVHKRACEDGCPVFTGASNMLAIIWGVADKPKAKKIIKYIKTHNLEHFSIEVNYPRYPDKNVLFIFKLMGIKDYHNGMAWLWIGCMGVLAYMKAGEKKQAKYLLRKISRKIVEFGEVYEVYEPTGEPVNRRFYKSAYPFAWTAGLYIYMYEKYKSWK